jgi:uncharacterized membrane protein YcaP (DUF421 family)
MKKEEIHLDDWYRILIGQAPLEYMLEVLIRAVVIYICLIIAMRIMGKRMTAQMSVFELAVAVMLGAIIAVPLQLPDRGILVGLFVLFLAVTFHRFLNLISFYSSSFEEITQGKSSIILKNGKLQLNEMKKASLSRESLFANLRKDNIMQLGQIKRIYLEGSGDLSIYKNKDSIPGLSILPDIDNGIKSSSNLMDGSFACVHCGRTEQTSSIPTYACEDCNNNHWTKAIN